jgi:hypothetical protein
MSPQPKRTQADQPAQQTVDRDADTRDDTTDLPSSSAAPATDPSQAESEPRGVSASPTQQAAGDNTLEGPPSDTVTGGQGGPVQARQGTPSDEEDHGSLLTDLRDAAVNLSPSEVPSPAELPAVVAALVHYIQHDEIPASLDERFPDE